MAKKFDPKAKAKRQKIIAAVGGLILVAVLAYEVPTLMAVLNKKAPPPPVIQTAAPTSVVPAAPSGVGTPVSAPATSLSNTDPVPQAGSGQLLSFDRFQGKDPFVQQANKLKAPAVPAKPVPPPPPPPPPVASKPPAGSTKATSAQISVNGVTEQVAVGATFPAASPVFLLVSATKTSAKIGIAGGSLSTGTGTVTLMKGKKVTLMNTADGTRYELILVSAT